MSSKDRKEAIEYYDKLRKDATAKAEADAFLDVIVGGAVAEATGTSASGQGGASGSGLSREERRALSCSPLGILGINPALVAEIKTWGPKVSQAVEEICWDNRLRERLL